MRRTRQQCVSCTPSEWRRIGELARASGKTISRFVIETVLGPEHRLALGAEEQRDLANRVNRLLLISEDLAGPLPGSDVSLAEAVAFLRHDAVAARPQGDPEPAPAPTRNRQPRPAAAQRDLFGGP